MEGEVDPRTQKHVKWKIMTNLMYKWRKTFGRYNMTLMSTTFFYFFLLFFFPYEALYLVI